MTTIRQILATTICEWKHIATNISILLVMIGGNIGYGFLYNYMYNPNTVKEAPIAVVDMAGDVLSHTFIQNLDATEQVSVAYTIPDYAKAEELLRDRKIVGFLYLPQNFSKLGSNYNHSNIMAYGSTLSFLDFLMLQEATTYTLLDFNAMLRPLYVSQLPDKQKYALAQLQPIEVIPSPLFNVTEGYGTYLIPPVLMLIIFQTMMICISISAGEERESKHLHNIKINTFTYNKSLTLVVGKTIAYTSIYSIISLFMLGL
ncbi:MAG: ABC transporter permease, partial [Bacteroidales bacterium]|nr:ABC transporter permease [Bacteroidales bacterium]